MKTVNSDGFLHVRSNGDGAEIVEPQAEQIAIPEENTATNNSGMTKTIHELAEGLGELAIETAQEIGTFIKYEACKELLFGAMALAAGEMEECLAQQPDTRANEIELEITDLIKDASMKQAIDASEALQICIKQEERALVVATAAKAIANATEQPEKTDQRWSLFPSW